MYIDFDFVRPFVLHAQSGEQIVKGKFFQLCYWCKFVSHHVCFRDLGVVYLSQNCLRHIERQAVAAVIHFSEFSLSSRNRLRFFCLVEWTAIKTKWKMSNFFYQRWLLKLVCGNARLKLHIYWEVQALFFQIIVHFIHSNIHIFSERD